MSQARASLESLPARNGSDRKNFKSIAIEDLLLFSGISFSHETEGTWTWILLCFWSQRYKKECRCYISSCAKDFHALRG